MIGELAGLAAAACWAGGSLLFERIGASTSAGAMNLGKTTSAFAVLLLASVMVRGGTASLDGTPLELGLLAGSAVVGITIGDTAFFGAVTRLGAPRAVLLLSTAPVFAVVIESLRRASIPPPWELAGTALTLAGVALVLTRSPLPGTARSTTGVWLGILAALSQGAGSVMSRGAMGGRIDPLSASWGRLLVAGIALAVLGVASGRLASWVRELTRKGTLVRVGAASFLGVVCGLFLSQVALARASSAGVAATLLATVPIFALPLAHVTRSEAATPRAIASRKTGPA